jgi:hypothetical protein
MISLHTIENALYLWATAALGPLVPVIWYHLNAPRPVVPYVAMHLFSIRSVGVDAQLSPDGDGEIEIVGNRDFSLECQAIGLYSRDYLEKLKMSLERPAVQQILRTAGICIVDRGAITDLTSLVDSRWEERNTIEFFFRFAQVDIDAPGYFERTNIQTDLIGCDNITITIDTITVPA